LTEEACVNLWRAEYARQPIKSWSKKENTKTVEKESKWCGRRKRAGYKHRKNQKNFTNTKKNKLRGGL